MKRPRENMLILFAAKQLMHQSHIVPKYIHGLLAAHQNMLIVAKNIMTEFVVSNDDTTFEWALSGRGYVSGEPYSLEGGSDKYRQEIVGFRKYAQNLFFSVYNPNVRRTQYMTLGPLFAEPPQTWEFYIEQHDRIGHIYSLLNSLEKELNNKLDLFGLSDSQSLSHQDEGFTTHECEIILNTLEAIFVAITNGIQGLKSLLERIIKDVKLAAKLLLDGVTDHLKAITILTEKAIFFEPIALSTSPPLALRPQIQPRFPNIAA